MNPGNNASVYVGVYVVRHKIVISSARDHYLQENHSHGPEAVFQAPGNIQVTTNGAWSKLQEGTLGSS